jgi:hypothetical protein
MLQEYRNSLKMPFSHKHIYDELADVEKLQELIGRFLNRAGIPVGNATSKVIIKVAPGCKGMQLFTHLA